MKIETPNVFVGFGGDSLAKMLEDGFSYSNLVEELQKDSKAGFLFSTDNNANFIGLQHEINSGGGPGNYTFTLKLIDPLGEFEKRFLSFNVLDALINKNTAGLMEIFADENTSIESQNKLLKSTLYKNILIEAIRRDPQRKLHISYGIGRDLSTWQGPFEVHLTNGSVELDPVRVLTLTFVPTTAALDNNNYDSRGNVFSNISPRTVQVRGYSADLRGERSLAYKLNENLKNIDFHLILVDTLKDFCRKAAQTTNTLVLLPDINKVCKPLIDSIVDTISYEVKDRNIIRAAGIAGNQVYSDFTARLEVSNEDAAFLKKIYIIRRVFAEFGLEVVTTPYTEVYRSINTGAVSTEKDEKLTDSVQDSLKALREEYGFYVRASCNDEQYSNFKLYLDEIIQNINQKSGSTKPLILETKVEVNSRILKYWRTLGKYQTFTRALVAGNTDFSDNEIHVVGDKHLISNYLYPREELISTEASPLHPTDSIILKNPNYIDTMIKILKSYAKQKLERQYIPDEFVLKYGSQEALEKIKRGISDANLPTFRFNTTNPNILSLSIQNTQGYFTQLNTLSKVFITTKARKSILEQDLNAAKIIKIKSDEQLLRYIKARLALSKNSNITAEDIIDEAIEPNETQEKDIDNFKSYIQNYIDLLKIHDNFVPEISLSEFDKSDENVIMNELLEYIQTYAFQIDITTLPTFSISNIADLGKSCFLFCGSGDIIQTKTPKISKLNAMVTGIYQILGITHSITFDDCKSSFRLAKANSAEGIKNFPNEPQK
jgi:hypothetical protein